ncbi:hypothetical protein [Streptomyces sp. OE57]|uniref:hypothetical protein n=1 Tax=Streptomyces lacaronensis TaxID=3379885 RepID=UPI0039B73333
MTARCRARRADTSARGTGVRSGAGLLSRSRRVARGLNVFSGTVFTGPAVRLAASPR